MPYVKNSTFTEYKFAFLLLHSAEFSFTSLSSFFTHIETNQSVGGAKTGVPGKKNT